MKAVFGCRTHAFEPSSPRNPMSSPRNPPRSLHSIAVHEPSGNALLPHHLCVPAISTPRASPLLPTIDSTHGAPLKKVFESKCQATNTTKVSSRSSANMSMEMFIEDLTDRNVLKDVTVAPTPAVTGAPTSELTTHVTRLDSKRLSRCSAVADAPRGHLSWRQNARLTV